MGLFDTIHFRCPNCDTAIEAQTKAGDCYLANHDSDKVPSTLAADINGRQVGCPGCERVFTITAPIPTTVCMELRQVNIFPSDEE